MSTLAEWFTTWWAAQQPSISVARVQWRELERLTAAIGPLRPFIETSSVAEEIVSAVRAARRLLTATPLPPTDPIADLAGILGVVERFLVDRPDHTMCGPLQPLRDALSALMVSSSPIAAKVTEILSDYGVTPTGDREAVVVVPRRPWLESVCEWLTNENLSGADVACVADLRFAPVRHRAVVLVGHPATSFASAFKQPDVTLRELGWLLTAPAAATVRLVLPSDVPRLRSEQFWLLPEQAQPRLELHDDDPQQGLSAQHDWLQGFAPSPARPKLRLGPAAPGDEALPAVELQLASGYTVFFHQDVGPRPQKVAVDDETGAVAYSAVTLAAVTGGVVIAVRIGAAEHSQVLARAEVWVKQHRGWSATRLAEVRGYAATLKAALRRALAVRGFAELHRELTATLSDDYARVLLHNPLDEWYIAPQRRAGFDALVRAIGAAELLDKFDDLATVRTAHRQAGEEIRRKLLALLSNRAWVDDVDEEGSTVVHDDELGSLLLAVVTAKLDELVEVPRTWLGVAIDEAGRRLTAPPIRKERP